MNTSLKICILSDGIPPEGKGGAERVAWESALALKEAGHEVTVITTTRAAGARTIESLIDGVSVFSIPSTYHDRWRYWRGLYNPVPVRETKRLLAELRPDIVHAHNVHGYLSYAVLPLARACGARVFHTLHDAMPVHSGKLTTFLDPKDPVCKTTWNYRVPVWHKIQKYRLRYNPFWMLYVQYALSKVHVKLAVSDALREALAQNGIKDLQVLHNGIDVAGWQVSETQVATFVQKHGLTGKKLIVFGGRLSASKGGDALLAALPQIVAAVPETALLIMGTGDEYLARFKAQIEEQGLNANVAYTGWITGNELKAAYHAATGIAAPTVSFEPLSMIAIEAMACGKPVVGSCYGGITEVIEDSVTGYLVHPLATPRLAARLIEILTDTELAARFGRAGNERVVTLFSQKRHLERLVQLYQAAL